MESQKTSPAYEALNIRRYSDADSVACFRVFFTAVHEGTVQHYTPEERRAWLPNDTPTQAWRERLAAQWGWLAERGGKVVGFMTLKPDGYLDLAFVLPDEMGKGTSVAIYDQLERYAQEVGLSELTTDASFLAKPFFQRRGWQVRKQQTVERDRCELTNFKMEKRLFPPK